MNLTEYKKVLIEYAKMKLDDEDFHAVADAAMDLREIDIRIKHFNELNDVKSSHEARKI